MFKMTRVWIGLILLAGRVVPSALATTLPVQEGFETYADATTLNTLSNQGWGAV